MRREVIISVRVVPFLVYPYLLKNLRQLNADKLYDDIHVEHPH